MLTVVPPGGASEHDLDGALAAEFAGVNVERVADCGDAARRVAEFAHNRDVDMVMMPTHGLGLFRTVLSGSVTSTVIHDVLCPVWTAAHADSQRAPAIPRRILCAVDATNEGVRLLQHAALFSKRVGATLSVLHVVEPVSDCRSLECEPELQEDVRDTAAQAIESMLRSASVEATTRVVVGGITERAAEAARAENVDLVIVGRGAVHEPFARLRTHIFGIVEQSPCPVLSV
jgi:nucleotide-binding universal stress UspA family protein